MVKIKVNRKLNKSQIRQIRKAAKKGIPDVIDKLCDLLETGMDLFTEEQESQSQKRSASKKVQKEKQKKDK